jgi:hypothetical protein
MKSTEIFDACHGRYRGLREWLADSTGSVRSLDFEKPSAGYLWRPDRARACDYVADFERIGRHALRRPEWKGRLKLFNVYFLRGAEYRRSITGIARSSGRSVRNFRARGCIRRRDISMRGRSLLAEVHSGVITRFVAPACRRRFCCGKRCAEKRQRDAGGTRTSLAQPGRRGSQMSLTFRGLCAIQAASCESGECPA